MVLAEIRVDKIYVVCGYTDMRKSITGLTAIIVQQYQLKPNDRCIFLFCGKRADRMKALLWEGDGFLLLYKVLSGFRYHWPRSAREVRSITPPQYHRLLEGLEIERKRFPVPKDLV
jgi:transposase